MDPIFDRLGRLLRSNRPFSASVKPLNAEDQAAFDELEAELNAPKGAPKKPSGQSNRTYQEQRRQESSHASPRPTLDPKLSNAFATLGLSPLAPWDQINAAHKSLLKKHHPDRHGGNETLMKQATLQSQQINEAYQTLKKHLGQ